MQTTFFQISPQEFIPFFNSNKHALPLASQSVPFNTSASLLLLFLRRIYIIRFRILCIIVVLIKRIHAAFWIRPILVFSRLPISK
jgi:hypothetical protein